MTPRTDLEALAARLGIASRYRDGLGNDMVVSDETLVRLSASLGAPVTAASDAAAALAWLDADTTPNGLPPVLVAWDGLLQWPDLGPGAEIGLLLEDGTAPPVGAPRDAAAPGALPWGYHRLVMRRPGGDAHATILSAPTRSWHRDDERPAWGVATHLAALRSARSRSVGDLRDLETTCQWVRGHGADLVTVLPLLPTFNEPPAEPSPYAPVSRLFWSELVLDLGERHRPVPPPDRLDVARAAREVREALGNAMPQASDMIDAELLDYARFRGAQARLGRNWHAWPEAAKAGRLRDDQVDPDEMRFHLVAQLTVREQLAAVRERLDALGVRLGLDLAVGVHSDGYDPWSRQDLFALGMSVGAPPDPGFPSGQDWGFPPVLPTASREEGHAYLAAALRHQARLAGVLRIDHVMAFRRLYWIPQGMSLDQGSYVDYPAEELFAIATLESHRQQCELVGENLGTVPEEMHAAMARHGVHGMYVAQFAAHGEPIAEPGGNEVASIGTHDTPTLAGWLAGSDIPERLALGLLTARNALREQAQRADAVERLATHLGVNPRSPERLLEALLTWLGASASPLVTAWLEDLWLEPEGINIPGTGTAVRPNWQRPMQRLLDEVMVDPDVVRRLRILDRARSNEAGAPSGAG